MLYAGEAYVSGEGEMGEFGFYLISYGANCPSHLMGVTEEGGHVLQVHLMTCLHMKEVGWVSHDLGYVAYFVQLLRVAGNVVMPGQLWSVVSALFGLYGLRNFIAFVRVDTA